MLTCREVVNSADHLIERELSRRQQLAMKVHLLMCRHCRRYVRQLRALLQAIPFMHSKASDSEVRDVMEHIQSHQSESR
ncbi:zf-HC2 domain-containing protein [Chromatocurvus halotolerans]|uniref:Uncharacterized protein n=1 Tax=Chromatocurvus halotolerans TaxID=1132028 RepID=A0A4R2LF47_9GAMM|nr:zf-HC2 domain-containing protein [Chromatocurvus halotolerans]TCO77885.1 hypothetical protein EV688_102345 [Chromatocurvus halotolerans]